MRREYGEGKGEENEIGSWRVLHHPPLWLSRRGIGEVEREKSFCKHIRLSLMLLRYPYPTYRRAAGKSKQKNFFRVTFGTADEERSFFFQDFSKIYRTIPLTLKKKGQQRRVREKRKLPLALPPSHFFVLFLRRSTLEVNRSPPPSVGQSHC